MKAFFASLFVSLSILSLFGQQKPDILAYIKKYKHIAIEEMVRTRIPASITMAQGILESGCGKSPLSIKANNHFGIKCKTEWNGKKFFQDDDEAQECFRVYEHAEASYVDHSDFLLTRYRYAPLFQLPPTDYKSWASGLKEVGYATNPRYAEILTGYIETYKLHELDLAAISQIEEKEKLLTRCETTEHTSAAIETKNIPPEAQPVVEIINKPNMAIYTKAGRQELLVNGVRAIKAIGDEDPLQVAFDYNIDYSFVMAFNDLATGERFESGENIFLQPKKNRGEQATYTVQNGETMRAISQRLGIKLKDLYAKNLMAANEQALSGEVLYLQETRRTGSPRTMSSAEYLNKKNERDGLAQRNVIGNTARYQVQQSDTLYSIAKKFNTTVDELKKLNNLETAELKTGQTIVVAQ